MEGGFTGEYIYASPPLRCRALIHRPLAGLKQLPGALGDKRVVLQARVPVQQRPGGLLGLLQQGHVPAQIRHLQGRQAVLAALKVADLSCNMALLKEAQQAAERLLERDPELEAHLVTAQRVEELFQNSGGTLN